MITADAGYHSEANLKQLAELPVAALIADTEMRRRDERFATQERHKAAADPLHDKTNVVSDDTPALFQPSDFTYDAAARTCICPAGKTLNRNGARRVIRDDIWDRFVGKKRDCAACPLRARCIRTPATTKVRAVVFFQGKTGVRPDTHTTRMKRRIDSAAGRQLYGRRVGIVEPVFGNLRYNKGLDRFTLRGRAKVDGQWKRFCLVQNIEKLAHTRFAA